MVAVTGLANGNLGQALTGPLLADCQLLCLCREEIRPYYQRKRDLALAAAHEFFPTDAPWAFHASEGALFLWLWLENTRKSSRQIYEDLKARGVIVVSGEYFFFGGDTANWPHRRECLRISFAMDEKDVHTGLKIIGEEVARSSA
jgi:valine--pyruvate aminotransferase